eukprot:362174-Chlamydomonas_euryale.AAC.2
MAGTGSIRWPVQWGTVGRYSWRRMAGTVSIRWPVQWGTVGRYSWRRMAGMVSITWPVQWGTVGRYSGGRMAGTVSIRWPVQWGTVGRYSGGRMAGAVEGGAGWRTWPHDHMAGYRVGSNGPPREETGGGGWRGACFWGCICAWRCNVPHLVGACDGMAHTWSVPAMAWPTLGRCLAQQGPTLGRCLQQHGPGGVAMQSVTGRRLEQYTQPVWAHTQRVQTRE